MTQHTMIGHTLNSGYAILPAFRPAPTEAALTVLWTNVPYLDDLGMRDRLAAKRAEYPDNTRFLLEPHDWFRTVSNFDGQDLIIDSVNLWVSNIMLKMNSQPQHRDAIMGVLVDDLHRFAAWLDAHPDAWRHVYWITAEVDHDPFIRSPLGQIYHECIHLTNAAIQQIFAPRRGILLNGHALWASAGEPQQ